jgi:hypothetical protein
MNQARSTVEREQHLAGGVERGGTPMTVWQAFMFGMTPSLVLLALILCGDLVSFDDD